MNNKGILYVWDRGIDKAFLRGNRLLGFWALEQSGHDSGHPSKLTPTDNHNTLSAPEKLKMLCKLPKPFRISKTTFVL